MKIWIIYGLAICKVEKQSKYIKSRASVVFHSKKQKGAVWIHLCGIIFCLIIYCNKNGQKNEILDSLQKKTSQNCGQCSPIVKLINKLAEWIGKYKRSCLKKKNSIKFFKLRLKQINHRD